MLCSHEQFLNQLSFALAVSFYEFTMNDDTQAYLERISRSVTGLVSISVTSNHLILTITCSLCVDSLLSVFSSVVHTCVDIFAVLQYFCHLKLKALVDTAQDSPVDQVRASTSCTLFAQQEMLQHPQ